MQIYIKEANEIYSSKTKKYFKEVISSYENENYRSAIVMLYSVVVCDILFKLQELVDKYDDSGAKNILDNFKKNSKDSNKSKWESKLLEDVNNRTELIDEITFEQLNQLKVYRNWAAHPILNENFDLSEPSKETVISFILVMLNKILIKPSIFIKNIFNSLAEDLSENEEIYTNNYGGLENYLERKYFCRMPQSMKNKIFKSLWKISFNIPEDDNCIKNRKINTMALQVLVKNNQEGFIEYINSDNSVFTVSIDEECGFYLIWFLSIYPKFYSILEDSVKDKIKKVTSSNVNANSISWFVEGDLIKHLEVIKKECASMDSESIEYIFKYYSNNGYETQFIDTCINLFALSKSFDSANIRFYKYINPYLKKMNSDQLVKLIEEINDNNQIYGRREHNYTCEVVYAVAKEKLDDDFCFAKYENFYIDSTKQDCTE